MTGSDILVLAWLVLAHLVADFLLQTDRVVADKSGDGRRAWRGLGMHGAAVALCLVPFALAFGVPGLGLLVAVTIGHVVIDRWKTLATRAAERPAGSYTAELLGDPPRIGEKVREEAEEVARAAREESDERVAEEAADVLYHLAVLLRSRELSVADAEEVLNGRRR